jgi:hypothetical protein
LKQEISKEKEDRMAEAGRLASNIGKVGIQYEKRVKIYDGSSSRSRSSDASE